MDITELLAFSVEQGASDLHLSAGLPPMIRVDGDVRRVNVPAQDHAEVQALVYDIMNDRQRKDLEEFLETDFSFEVPGVARFRVNAFNQHPGGRCCLQDDSLRGTVDGNAGYGSGVPGHPDAAQRLGAGNGPNWLWQVNHACRDD